MQLNRSGLARRHALQLIICETREGAGEPQLQRLRDSLRRINTRPGSLRRPGPRGCRSQASSISPAEEVDKMSDLPIAVRDQSLLPGVLPKSFQMLECRRPRPQQEEAVPTAFVAFNAAAGEDARTPWFGQHAGNEAQTFLGKGAKRSEPPDVGCYFFKVDFSRRPFAFRHGLRFQK